MNTPSAFEQATAVVAEGSGRYRTSLDSAWNIGVNPNGGYAQTAGIRAMADTIARPDPMSVTSHFLRPASGDAAAAVETTEIRSGRRLATVAASLVQDGRERIRSVATFGDLGAVGSVAAAELSPPPVELPAPDDCPSRLDLEQGVELPILDMIDVRVDPRWQDAAETGRAEIGGWIRLADGGPVDAVALTMFADAFPPSIFSLLGRVGWVPTIELTVHVRRRPVVGWIRGRFRTVDLADGHLIEDGELWDDSGALVARSRQLALVTTDDA